MAIKESRKTKVARLVLFSCLFLFSFTQTSCPTGCSDPVSYELCKTNAYQAWSGCDSGCGENDLGCENRCNDNYQDALIQCSDDYPGCAF